VRNQNAARVILRQSAGIEKVTRLDIYCGRTLYLIDYLPCRICQSDVESITPRKEWESLERANGGTRRI
jgi:hypothetical protein